jgi:plasmid stabilization system protein ParE
MKTIREEIKKHIIEELQKAKSEILIAVSWFNDTDLFDLICEKAKQHVKIEVIITNDHINIDKNKINWYNLIDLNGKVYLYRKGKIMHLKECIIDDEIFIQGTYNWTNNASKNVESINVFYNNEINIEETKAEYKKVKLTCELLTRNPRKRYNNSIIKEINSKYGIFDVETDETYIAAIYDEIREMSDDMIFVRRNHEGGFLNEKLEFVIPLSKEFKYCGDFYYGAAINIKREYFWSDQSRFKEFRENSFLIDKNGNEIKESSSLKPYKKNIWQTYSTLIFIDNINYNHNLFDSIHVKMDNEDYYFYSFQKKILYLNDKIDEPNTLLNYSNNQIVELLDCYDCFKQIGLFTLEIKIDGNRFVIITNKDKSKIHSINASEYSTIQYFKDFIIFDGIKTVYFSNDELIYKKYINDSLIKIKKDIIIDNDNIWLLTENKIYIFSTKTFKIIEEIDLLGKYKNDFISLFKKEKLNEFKNLINKIKNDIKLEIEQKKKKTEKEAHDARMKEIQWIRDVEVQKLKDKKQGLLILRIAGVMLIFGCFYSLFNNGGFMGVLGMFFGCFCFYRSLKI